MPEASAAPPALQPPTRGTLLGFDFGLMRTGVAVGELETGHASALETIHAESADQRFASVSRLVAEWQPVGLVVGMPLALDGSAHEMTARCKRFANQLRGRYRLPVWECDERFSSAEAETQLRKHSDKNWRQRKQLLDSVAAQIILQTFLDSRQ